MELFEQHHSLLDHVLGYLATNAIAMPVQCHMPCAVAASSISMDMMVELNQLDDPIDPA